MGLISRKQMALNSALVIVGLFIGVGVIMAVQANAIDLDSCDNNFVDLYI